MDREQFINEAKRLSKEAEESVQEYFKWLERYTKSYHPDHGEGER